MRARVPASSANLGPGFDTLAIALSLYVEVDIQPADRLTVRAEGEGCEIPADHSHLAARVAMDIVGHERMTITVRSDIPVARGLGSSAALAAAAAAAAGASDPLAVAAAVDGHPENAAASVLGGLVTATTLGGKPVASRLPLDDQLAFVAVIPDRELATKKARAALPESVPHADAVFNLGRMGLLLSGLADHRRLVREAMDDKLHQAFRTTLFPEATVLLEGLVDCGALAACWSGAGPTLLGICTQDRAEAIRRGALHVLEEAGVEGTAQVLTADNYGVIVTES